MRVKQGTGLFLFIGFGFTGLGLLAACANGTDGSTNETDDAQDGVDSGITPPPSDASHDVASSTDTGSASGGCRPGAAETCNGIDDNCDGQVDEGFDKDNDTYFECAHGTLAADCDDSNPAVHPGATETCNNVDDDCDGKIDNGFDVDNDTYFQCAHGTTPQDCNDNDPAIHPGATETCDGKDNDCNGKVDDLAARIPASGVDSFAVPVNTHWIVTGNANINTTTTGWALLTPDANLQSGQIWWNATYVFDHFDATFTFVIDNKSGGADGIAFGWVPGSAFNAGGSGSGYGFINLGGYAVVVDTFQNSGEPAVPFLTVIDGTGNQLIRQAIPNVRDGFNHTMRVVYQHPIVSAFVDNTQYINAFTIPNAQLITGHWGLTAGTGNSSERHLVTGISIAFPDGQGCVP